MPADSGAVAAGARSLTRWIARGPTDGEQSARGRRWIHATVASIALLLAVTVAVEILDDHAPVQALGVLYLLAVVPVAVLWGMLFATAVSVVSVLTFSYLFVPPRREFDLGDAGNWYALIVFNVTAIVVSELAARSQREARASTRLAEEQSALRRVATLVAQQTSREQLDALISEEVGRLLSTDLAVMCHYEEDGGTRLMGQWMRSTSASTPVYPGAVARVTGLIAQTGAPARIENNQRGEGESVSLSAVGAPIIVEGEVWGAMVVASGHRLPSGTDARLADFTALVAIAIANAKNRADLAASRERVVLAADETRRRIERDLHDGAQQQLVALSLDLQAMHENVPDDLPELRAGLGRVAGGLVSTLDELREIARGIHPAILVQGGLEPAIKTLARRCPVPVELNVDLSSRLPEAIEVATYYVVAESLTNAAKHADASLIRVIGEVRDGTLCVSVEDDGKGGANPARGSGLVGLMDRVEAVGGRLTVDSTAEGGTSVVLSLPLPGASPDGRRG